MAEKGHVEITGVTGEATVESRRLNNEKRIDEGVSKGALLGEIPVPPERVLYAEKVPLTGQTLYFNQSHVGELYSLGLVDPEEIYELMEHDMDLPVNPRGAVVPVERIMERLQQSESSEALHVILFNIDQQLKQIALHNVDALISFRLSQLPNAKTPEKKQKIESDLEQLRDMSRLRSVQAISALEFINRLTEDQQQDPLVASIREQTQLILGTEQSGEKAA